MAEWTPLGITHSKDGSGSWEIVYDHAEDGELLVCWRSPWPERAEESHAAGDRLVACYNTMAGRDPSKLAALEAALDRVLEHETVLTNGVRAALKAFRGEE